MKKLLFFAAVTAVALSSCSKDEVTTSVADAQNAISFSTYSASATKAIEDASLTTNGFMLDVRYNDDAETAGYTGIYGAVDTDGDVTTYVSADTGADEITLYWPADGEKLDFIAYSGLTKSSIATASEATFTHSATGETDPIVAYNEGVEETSNIALTFKHALAKVITVVEDNNTNDDLDLYITSVSYAVNTGGTCTVTSSSTTWEDNTTGSFDAFSDTETVAASVETTDFTAIPQESVTVSIKGCWKQGTIVIEDFLTTAKTATVSPAAANSAYTYTYTITPNVTEITFTAEIDSNGWDETPGTVTPDSDEINQGS